IRGWGKPSSPHGNRRSTSDSRPTNRRRPLPGRTVSSRRTTTTNGSRSTNTAIRLSPIGLIQRPPSHLRRFGEPRPCGDSSVRPQAWIAASCFVLAAAVLAGQTAPAAVFTDVTAQSGIRFVHNNGAFGKKYLPETLGAGVVVLDADGDGWQDLLFVNSMNWPG